MKKGLLRMSLLCMLLMVTAMAWADTVEKTIYSTKFQDWSEVKSSTTESTVSKTTTDGQTLTFSLMETQVAPAGTQDKFTSDCITAGYLMCAKTATPYIKTSTLKSVTSVVFVHAATGSNRGWGLKVKGDGDADWVTVSDAVANPASGQSDTVKINRTNVQLWFYNLSPSNNAYMTSLAIKGNVEVAPRTFTDFKIDFRPSATATVVVPESGTLPEGVVLTPGTYKDAQHGTQKASIKVPVDGAVKFTIGGCTYSKGATVTNKAGVETDINTAAAGCENAASDITTATYNKYATYTYNSESADTLTFYLGSYCPYFIAEKTDFIPEVTVSYYNTDGKLLGEEVVAGSSELKYKFSASDVTVAEGKAFRGWFESTATTALKVAEGKELTEDLRLYAHATDIEKAEVGTHFDWDLTKGYWYDEDHEAISINGKYYNNHGWNVGKTNSIKIAVGGKCYVNVKNCQYSASQTAVVTTSAGKEVATFEAKASADGATSSFTYDGDADTLVITYPSGAYVHGVEVYNVADFVAYDATTGYYVLSAGDGASLMMLLKSAKKGDKFFLPNGTYDFGEVCLTSVSADSVSIIGESQDGVIIQNSPLVEGIGATATLLLTGSNIYMQDLSIKCSSEKCATASASRCVTIQDKGTKNICKNVSLLSGQDTYYSNGTSTQRAFFDNCYITGTVDFLCGGGDVVFNNTTLYVLARSVGNVIAAPNTNADTKWGYVMLGCTIDGDQATQAGKYSFCRPWNNSPACTWINTTMNLKSSAAGYSSMTSNLAVRFHEYNTKDADGNVITTHNLDACNAASSDDLYITEDKAAEYTIANVLSGSDSWNPEQDVKQVTNVADGTVFLVDGKITTVAPTSGNVRVANARGGFGPTIDVATAIKSVEAATAPANAPIYNIAGQRIASAQKGVFIQNGKKFVVK